jgi:hypothetical protein
MTCLASRVRQMERSVPPDSCGPGCPPVSVVFRLTSPCFWGPNDAPPTPLPRCPRCGRAGRIEEGQVEFDDAWHPHREPGDAEGSEPPPPAA